MARCRGCREEIDFVQLRSGALHPVEAATPEVYYVDLNDRTTKPQVTLVVDGAIIRGRSGKSSESGLTRVVGVESHFARCSAAGEFSGRGRRDS